MCVCVVNFTLFSSIESQTIKKYTLRSSTGTAQYSIAILFIRWGGDATNLRRTPESDEWRGCMKTSTSVLHQVYSPSSLSFCLFPSHFSSHTLFVCHSPSSSYSVFLSTFLCYSIQSRIMLFGIWICIFSFRRAGRICHFFGYSCCTVWCGLIVRYLRVLGAERKFIHLNKFFSHSFDK